jgi:hypothetical protein
MDSNDFRSAIKEFKAALKEKKHGHRATLYLGIALSRSGSNKAETVLKKALSMDPSNPRTNLELGIYYYGASRLAQARDYFESTARLAPGTEFATRADEYLSLIEGAVTARPWSLNLSLGGQYDSNVVLDSGTGPLPEGVSRKSDWRAVAYLKGRYNIFTNDKIESSAGYTLYQSVHASLSDFNISQHILDLTAAYRITPDLRIRGIYSFEYVLVGGNGYDLAHTLAPALILDEGRGFSSTLEYRYRKNHYMNAGLFTDNSDRSGHDNLIEITQIIPLHRLVRARASYSYDVDSTSEDFWHYSGNRVTAGLAFALPWKLLMNVDGEYYNTKYEGVSPMYGTRRKDEMYSASLSVTRPFCERYSVTAGQAYVRNKSNIDVFDYKRSITSLFLSVRF